MLKMKRKILQSIGDSILKGLETTKHDDIAYFYYELGMWFDSVCIFNFDVYLD